MTRHLLGLFVLLFPVLAHAQDVVDARLLWRSSEVDGGVVLGDVRQLVPSAAGVVATFGFLGIEAVLIDADGTTSRSLDIQGESPGHVDRPEALDMARDGSAIAIVAGMRGHGTYRTPIEPPFDRVLSFDPLPEPAGMSQRHAVRLIDGAIVTHTGVQPSTNLDDLVVRLVRHALDGGEPTILLEERESPNAGIVGAISWVWDVTDDGRVHVSDDYYEGTIAVLAPDGSIERRIELPVELVRFGDEVIAQQKAQRESLRGKIPDGALPALREGHRAIAVISSGARDGHVRVVSSKGLGAGQDEIDRLTWWEVDATTGEVRGQRAVLLPGGRWALTTARWFDDRIYVAGNDLSADGAPEVMCFEVD